MNAAYYISFFTVPLLLYHNTRNVRKTTSTLSIIFPTSLRSLMILGSVLSYGHYGYDNQIQNPISALSARSGLFEFGLKLSRLTTCLDAASLHQFPKLLYKLWQSNQPCPIYFYQLYWNNWSMHICIYYQCALLKTLLNYISFHFNWEEHTQKHWQTSWMVIFLSSSHRWYIHHYVFP